MSRSAKIVTLRLVGIAQLASVSESNATVYLLDYVEHADRDLHC
jgi:hypothetical protein